MKFLQSKSFYTVAILYVLLLFFSIKNFQPNIISWDNFGYYLYLPAKFIYNDPGLKDPSFAIEMMQKYDLSATFYQVVPVENGNNIIKYSSGLAVVYSPFFFIAHVFTKVTSFPSDGFSYPYQLAIFISSLLFVIIGLLYLRKVLLHFFNEKTAAYTFIILILGTNLFSIFTYHTSIHLYLFAIYAALLWKTIQWHNDPTNYRAIAIGFLCGLLTLIRPTEAISVLIPLLWGVYDFRTLRKKWILIITHYWHIIFAVLAGVIMVMPQLLYWKSQTGQWLFYSYVNAGEGFDFLTPYIWQVLFSFRKGWLIYTPIMIFAIIGFKYLYQNHRKAFYPILVFSIINLYIVSSWTCWWYAGSFSQRALTQSYAVLAIPLAAFLHYVFSKTSRIKYSALGIIAILVFLNLFQHWQFSKGIIDNMRMTKPYYFAVFGKTTPVDEETKKLLLVERSLDENEDFKNKEMYFMREKFIVETSDTVMIAVDSVDRYKILNENNIFTSAFHLTFEEMTRADHAFILINAKVYPTTSSIENPFSLVATFEHKGKAYKYRALDSEKINDNLQLNQWNTVSMTYLTPDIRSKKDRLSVYYWLRGNKDLLVGQIEIEVWEPKRGW